MQNLRRCNDWLYFLILNLTPYILSNSNNLEMLEISYYYLTAGDY